jgi:hypothetical protein
MCEKLLGKRVVFGRHAEPRLRLRISFAAGPGSPCLPPGANSLCRCMSNRANSIWRTVCMPAWKFLAASILSNRSLGRGYAGFHVGGHVLHHVPFPAEVFHELGGQFHRVPFHAVDARHAQVLDLGEQVVQAVAEFVEQGDDVVVGEQGRFAADGAGEVAVEVGDRGLDTLALARRVMASSIQAPPRLVSRA